MSCAVCVALEVSIPLDSKLLSESVPSCTVEILQQTVGTRRPNLSPICRSSLCMTGQSTLNLATVRSTVMHTQSRWIQLRGRIVVIISCRHRRAGCEVVLLAVAGPLSLPKWSVLMPIAEHVAVAALMCVNRGLATTEVSICGRCAGR